jgi:hypothetical protein
VSAGRTGSSQGCATSLSDSKCKRKCETEEVSSHLPSQLSRLVFVARFVRLLVTQLLVQPRVLVHQIAHLRRGDTRELRA